MCKIGLSGVLKLLRIKAMLFPTLAVKTLQLFKKRVYLLNLALPINSDVVFVLTLISYISSWYRTLKTNLRLKDVNLRENAGILPEVLYLCVKFSKY